MRASQAALAAATLVTSLSAVAQAEPMDPALERLVQDSSCRTASGAWNDTPQPASQGGGSLVCRPDQKAFTRLISQYAAAFAPSAMHSARTTGYGGFEFALEANYTKISSDADYIRRGTRGADDPSSHASASVNDDPASFLSLYSLKFSKGFGFGLELSGIVGFMPQTSLISGGADLRLSLLEGFRTGIGGIFPDIAVGSGVRTISGTPQFQLTVVGLDAQASKPLPIADSQVLTPWIGYQYLWIFGDSGLIDLTPGTDAVRYCNYAGSNVPGNSDPDHPAPDGQPICRGGSPLDFGNNAVFDRVRLERQRFIVGANYRYEMVVVGAQLSMDLIPPEDAQNSDTDSEALAGEDRQYTLGFAVGAAF